MFNEQTKKRWVKLYLEDKKTIREIAMLTDSSYASIQRHLNKQGVIRPQKRYNDQAKELWVKLHVEDNKSGQTISEITGDNSQAIIKHLKKAKVFRSINKPYTKEDHLHWVELYKQGKTLDEIAIIKSVGYATIQRLIEKVGVDKGAP